jgi:hypothetical protein
MRVLRTRLIALLAAAFVALPAQAFARASYRCHMTGAVSHACCCAGKLAPKPCGAQIERQNCCEALHAADQASMPEARADLQDVPPAGLSAELLFVPSTRGAPDQLAPPAAALTHAPGPPRFLTHCAFLI